MNAAIATLLHPGSTPGGDVRFGAMAAVLGRTVEVFAPGVPFVAIVAGDVADACLEPLHRVAHRVVRVPLVSPAIRRSYQRGTLAKIHAWNLDEFERVWFLDADCWLIRSPQEALETPGPLVCCPGTESPLNAARMLLRPDREVFHELLEIATANRFTPERGWNDHGRFVWPAHASSPRPNEESDWRFNGASVDQGLLWYHFGLRRRELSYRGSGRLVAAAAHLGQGAAKFQNLPASYRRWLRELDLDGHFEDGTPNSEPLDRGSGDRPAP